MLKHDGLQQLMLAAGTQAPAVLLVADSFLTPSNFHWMQKRQSLANGQQLRTARCCIGTCCPLGNTCRRMHTQRAPQLTTNPTKPCASSTCSVTDTQAAAAAGSAERRRRGVTRCVWAQASRPRPAHSRLMTSGRKKKLTQPALTRAR